MILQLCSRQEEGESQRQKALVSWMPHLHSDCLLVSVSSPESKRCEGRDHAGIVTLLLCVFSACCRDGTQNACGTGTEWGRGQRVITSSRASVRARDGKSGTWVLVLCPLPVAEPPGFILLVCVCMCARTYKHVCVCVCKHRYVCVWVFV